MRFVRGNTLLQRLSILYLYRRLIPSDCRSNALFGGGAQKITIQLAGHFVNKGWEVHFCSDDAPDACAIQMLRSSGIKVYRLPFCSRSDGIIKCIVQIHSLIQKHRIRIVHCNDRWTLALGSLGAWRTGCRVVYTAHNVFVDKFITRIFLGKHIVAVSKGVEKNLHHDFCVPVSHIKVIYNGTNIIPSSERERYAVMQQWNLRPQDRVIAVIGRLSKQKGLYCLIQAARILHNDYSNLRILLVGDGELRESLIEKIAASNLQEVFLLCGHQDSVSSFIGVSEFAVMPSLWEGLGVSAIEALMLGKPVVATAVGGLIEVIEHGKNGFLVPPNDPKSLAQNIAILLRDPERSKSMGVYGQQVAKDKFALGAMMKNYEQYYADILAR